MNLTRVAFVVLGWIGASFAFAAKPAIAAEKATDAAAVDSEATKEDDVISLAAYNVKADRIEDFGLRVGPSVVSSFPKVAVGYFLARFAPVVTSVVPNTAAAKAGLQPGDQILKSDGQSMVGGVFSSVQMKKWFNTQKRKWAEVAAGKTNVTWTLEVQSPATKAVRIVKLVVPTPAPRWGASIWSPPEGRQPGVVSESGPLAERSRVVLDHGVWILLHERFTRPLGVDFKNGLPGDAMSGREPSGYEWHFGNDAEGSHQMIVTQFRGRTDIFLYTRSATSGIRIYHTSPSGELEKAWRWPQDAKRGPMPPAEATAGFAHELDLWTTKVGKVSARWPLELKPGYDANAIFATLAPKTATPTVAVIRPLVAEFLKLRAATETERALFTDAYGKLGADHDRWAYTETAHGLEDKRVTVTRIDPSKPESERSTLLSIDGKAPTPADVQRWRDDGGDIPKPLGEIPPLTGLVDLKDLRIAQDDAIATVFELPLQGGNAEFPAEKFQALFRVNKTRRGFEAITVKLRDSFRVAGVVKVTEAGLDLHFQTFDPTLAPQPVSLKAGGGVRVLLVKFSRSFEATRTDFKRVVPFGEVVAPAK